MTTQTQDQPVVRFLKEIQVELTKITWPTVPQIVANTVVVVVMVTVVSILLFCLDNAFHGLIFLLTKTIPKALGF